VRISVECGGFDDAADACRTANQTASLLTESLAGKLAGFGGMAGNDASSADFASSYDAAAREAVGSLVDLTHAFVGVGRLLTATGTNHASAEAAAADHVAAYTGLGLTGDTYVRVQAAPLPSSLGAQEPSLSGVDRFILDHVEGFVWPGADVSLLREAAHAWRRSSSAVAPLVDQVDIATTMIERQRSPEIPTALAALADLRSLVVDTAVELEAVGLACEDYAAAVEDTHDRTRALLAEVAGMLVEGAAVSVIIGGLTGGLGASASAAAADARIRAQAPRFHALLVGLRATVAAAGSRLRTAQDTLRDLRERLDRYAKLGVRDERGEIRHPGGWSLRDRVPGRPKPEVSDAKLQNYVDQLFKGVEQANRTGDGTTMDAIRYELATGLTVQNRRHIIKGQETLRGLENWLRRNPEPSADRAIASRLAQEIREALNS
jgi:hypothetical protein